MDGRGGKAGSESCELVAKVVDISGIKRLLEDLLDDREKVVQGSDSGEREGLWRPEGAAAGDQEQGRVDGVERYAALVQDAGETAVSRADAAEGAGSAAVELENAADIAASVWQGHRLATTWKVRCGPARSR
jgi:hypothetical protein